MNISVNGQSQVPPGFRFHPTEEELLVYYLKNKIASQKFEFDVIRDIDLNKLEPWDIQERCRIGSGPQNEWYLFSHKDKKYPTGSRTNRATSAGFWKATGRDKVIYGTGGTARNCTTSMCIGMRKTLVFYMGRAPHGHKSDWIMHEYRLLDDIIHMSNHQQQQQLLTKDVVDVDHSQLINNNAQASLTWEELDESSATAAADEGWVICRVFRKKNYVKAIDSNIINNRSTTTTTLYGGSSSRSKSSSSKSMNHMLNCQLGDQTDYQIERFIHLPQLESPTHHHLTAPVISISNTTTTTGTVTPTPTLLLDHDAGSTSTYQSIFLAADMRITNCCPPLPHEASSSTTTTRSSTSWVELDKLVAYHLNEQAAAGATDQSSDFDNTAGIVTSTTPEDHNFMNSSFQELLSSSDHHASSHDYNLWSCFSKRSSPAPSSTLDPISHLSVLL